ncbi:hypothetical protein [Iningainema tapete]|uniref:Uncharacterized protein n=1 Tax=Iningainema tapete BLCC-T55 TaxID=2748662 RepID=A0A8J7C5C9_9CYAN|nr:hypothetical protein [Iningainema tapete]MBD2770656.1 hypothetical protein [Iningainema tapete BLCC-T55]
MRLLKIKLLEGTTTWTASFGIAVLIMGGGACLGGLTATGIINIGQLLSPHRQTIQKALFYGSTASGAGLFLIGLASGLAVIGERLCDEEMERINAEIEQAKLNSKYAKCFQCKYYSSDELLPCTVHPGLKEDCTDWVENND